MCLLPPVQLKDDGSLGAHTCVAAYSEHSQLGRLLLSEAARVEHMLQTNANKKGQAQALCFFSISNIEFGKTERCSVHERLT